MSFDYKPSFQFLIAVFILALSVPIQFDYKPSFQLLIAVFILALSVPIQFGL